MFIDISDYDGITDRWMPTKRLFNFCRCDQKTVDFLGIHRSTQDMQEPVPIQAAKIAGIIPSLLEILGTKTRVVTISARHGRRPHLDNPDFSGIHQAPVGTAKSNVDSGLNAAGGGKRFGTRHVMIDGRVHTYEAHFACSIRVSDDRTKPFASP